MNFSDVPGATVSRAWSQISVLYSNVFRLRALSKDNLFRIAIGVGFNDSDGIPIIISSKTAFMQFSVWQEVKVPLRREYEGLQLYIFARISDVQWGSKGPVQFALKEGDSMIYDSASAKDNFATEEIVGELHGSHAPAALLAGANPFVVIPAEPKRRGGFIQNLLTNPVWVYFGDIPNPADRQTARVAKGGRIDIPSNYLGKITIDVKGQFTPDASLLASVQYLAQAAVV